MNQVTSMEYNDIVKKASPNSKSYKNIPFAFLIGGAICVVGQLLMEIYKYLGASKDITSTLASISLVLMSAILTGINVYDDIARIAGAGTLVPITGFANAVVSPALEFKSEGYILGLGAKLFVIAGPVIVYGTLASVLYGVIVFLFKL
ncbi:stage V sporulation protein AC [Paludicola sp. MB14-C6]|uniref:stage V sporulation protein AC n=1 Tax=Paludihabitans sp. MB14-C6 TaxID=3070656 RepID=UPI0027DBC947|nr:stage V sporulation protein AC [Paludicola sp. MB14-C6]WMJ24368.1 stage V sporulation protein AC [Paludicola sp. MB14-C6]